MTNYSKQLLGLSLGIPIIFGALILKTSTVFAQPVNTALTIRADTQEADSLNGIITARGNVKMNYPARQIDATSALAQYFSKERRIVLSGNVVVTQQGNVIKAETITYLIDQAKFEAVPETNQQVESVYIVPDQSLPQSSATTPVNEIKPAFKNRISPITVSPAPATPPSIPVPNAPVTVPKP
jgi:lipopolysaccharide export system protein LptA